MNKDQERYANKINTYTKALKAVGYSRISDTIGKVAASKLDMATDAFLRQQSDVVVATFLSGAQEYGEKHTNHDCLYEVLVSLK